MSEPGVPSSSGAKIGLKIAAGVKLSEWPPLETASLLLQTPLPLEALQDGTAPTVWDQSLEVPPSNVSSKTRRMLREALPA